MYNRVMMYDEDELLDDFQDEEDIESITYACEDCDHRWVPDDLDDMVCPLCGSENVVEL